MRHRLVQSHQGPRAILASSFEIVQLGRQLRLSLNEMLDDHRSQLVIAYLQLAK